ncbi:CPBP family intramembrane metalloprotease [Pantoea sp. Ap-967]|uniref:CPBP family intramembrane glutamic endopeptidase n=1 Tax=Pantoea sp. Ap-967 TaxID=2608362 RepID=UPI001423FBA6|nr:CPBP family intramembrane glutamic endopeptidase [Pantoea sp. Ap-967]NIE75257.1 CPBP family intramembrane metalloprotease [Pantoea sp. Ap-967]
MPLEALPILQGYLWRLLPLLGLFALWLWLTPRSQAGMHVLILLLAFVCTRDMMTPSAIWALGGEPPLRFHANPWVLAALGTGSLALLGLLARGLPTCWQWVVGFKGNRTAGIALGVAAGCLIGLPIRLHLGLGLAPLPWLLGFATLALAGNALEEVLFRGMLQGLLEQHTSPWRAALGSACAFAACHGYLALVLTDLGWPVMLFTFVEGLVCAAVRLKWGTWPAAAAHGSAILLIGAPLA